MKLKTTVALLLCLVGFFGALVEAQPLVHYTFNNGTATDLSGNGFEGTLLGSAAIVDDAERGKVMQINGSGLQTNGPLPFTTSFMVIFLLTML